MGRLRGAQKTGGRTAGTPNKIGKDLRPLLEAQVEALIPRIGDIWDQLSPAEQSRFLPALLRFVVPIQQDLPREGAESSTIQMTIDQLNKLGRSE